MICNKCGADISDGNQFCEHCGATVETVPEKNSKNAKFKIINVVLMIVAIVLIAVNVLMITGVFSFGKKVEGKGFNSPKDAVKAYIAAVNSGDMDKVLSTFAIESYVDNFDTKGALELYRAYIPNSSFYMTYEFSDGGDFERDIRIKSRQAIIMSSFYKMIVTRTANDNNMSIRLASEDEFNDFWKSYKKADFLNDWKEMEFIKIISPDSLCDNYSSDNVKKAKKNWKKVYGCDDLEDACALVEIDGEEYLQFVECGKYNGKWYIINCSGTLSSLMGVDTNSYGLEKCSDIDVDLE